MSSFVARIACSGYCNTLLTFMNMCFIERTASCVLWNAILILRRGNVAHLTTTVLVNIKHIGPAKFKVCTESTVITFYRSAILP